MSSPPNAYQFVAVVPAAGIGSRMGLQTPKQYLKLCGKTVLEHSIASLLQDPRIQRVVVALHPDDQTFSSLPIANDQRVDAVTGGTSRAESVKRALEFIIAGSPVDDQAVNTSQSKHVVAVVHDAARPCLSADDLSRVLDQFVQTPVAGALLAAPVRDTMKRADEHGKISMTVDREGLWHALTPQVFMLSPLLQALSVDAAEITDEASAMELHGVQANLVSGQGSNIKITHREDIATARSYLVQHIQQEEPASMLRIGQGFDVHKFGGSGPVYLGGVAIDHEVGLIAHSDGDVLLHALCDALLGALALGDIGHLFPDTDPAYSGADSKELLKHVYQRVTEKGYTLVNADITVMAETPKLKPHNMPIRQCISELLQTSVDNISVKATTTEQLGFTGRKEGIACQATVLLSQSPSIQPVAAESSDL